MTKMRNVVGWALIIIVPAIAWTLYLYTSRTTRHFTLASDYSALAAAIAIGIVGIFLVARTSRSRLLGTALYVPITGTGMYLGMASTTCVLGDCL